MTLALPLLVSPYLMEKTLILFTHPALENSRANRALTEAVKDLDEVTFHDLYETYPDFQIDVPREQALMESHQRIVWQFPFYWYSTPSLMKEWFDVVLEYGWAYGKSGTALHGKRVKTVVTTGGDEEAYCSSGHNGFLMEELMRPLEQTARLTGMEWLEPMVFFDALHLEGEAMTAATERYRDWLINGD